MEQLAERHQIVLAKETVRRIQIAAGSWIPRKLRAPKIQQPRTRRACVGALIQIDGCEHHWFEDRPPTLQGLRDQAFYNNRSRHRGAQAALGSSSRRYRSR
jgi:hypothetical protein